MRRSTLSWWSATSKSLAWAVILLVLASPLAAQCLDGSPSPCRTRPKLDTNVVAIVPFKVSGPPEVQHIGESVMDLLRISLDGVGRTRVLNSPKAFRRFQGLEDPSSVSSAAAVARDMGAGRMITATLVAEGDELRGSVEVYDSRQAKQQFKIPLQGDIKRLAPTVDTLASRILARRLVPLAVRRGRNIAEFTSASAAALQAFLIGEQLDRQGRHKEAADSLKSALALDSTFGLARYRLLRMEGAWAGTTGIPLPEILGRALQQIQKYPPRVQSLFAIVDAFQQGQRQRTLALVDQMASQYPNDADALFQRADKYFHFGANMGVPRAEILSMFRKAIALDDAEPELLEHHWILNAESGDSTLTFAAVALCARVVAACTKTPELDVVFRGKSARDLAQNDSSSYILGIGRFTPNDPFRALEIADSVATLQSAPTLSRNRRTIGFINRYGVALARGRYEAARAFVDSARTVNPTFANYSNYEVLPIVLSGNRTSEIAAMPPPANNLIALSLRGWAAIAIRAPRDSVARIINALEAMPWPDSAMGSALAGGLRGFEALQAGDTARARDLLNRSRLNQRRRNNPQRILSTSLFMSLTLSRIEVARRNYASARVALADAYPAFDALVVTGDAEELRGQISLAQGDTAAARRAFHNVVKIWSDGDAAVQPRVSAARAILARIDPVRP